MSSLTSLPPENEPMICTTFINQSNQYNGPSVDYPGRGVHDFYDVTNQNANKMPDGRRRRRRPAAAGGGLILGDRQAKACWDFAHSQWTIISDFKTSRLA
jgi:hypothetical protein